MHAPHLRMPFQPGGDLQGRRAMALHPQRQRLEAAQRQERIERPLDAADRVLQEAEPLAQFAVVADDRDAADHVGVAVEILGGRMHHQVEAVFERTLHDRDWRRCCRRRPDRPRRRAIVATRVEVDQLEQRIGRRLDPDQPGVRAGSPLRWRPDRTDRRRWSRAPSSGCAPARTGAASRHRGRRPRRCASRGRDIRARSRSPPARTRRQRPACRLRGRRCSARTPCASDSASGRIRSPCARRGSTARRSRWCRSASSPRRWSDRATARHECSGWQNRAGSRVVHRAILK